MEDGLGSDAIVTHKPDVEVIKVIVYSNANVAFRSGLSKNFVRSNDGCAR